MKRQTQTAAPLCYTACMDEKPDKPARPLRWYQFSLRTLLIGVALLSVCGGWFGKQILIVRERKQVLDEIQGSVNLVGGTGRACMVYDDPSNPAQTVNWFRWILDDRPWNVLFVPKKTFENAEMMGRIRAAFPELKPFQTISPRLRPAHDFHPQPGNAGA